MKKTILLFSALIIAFILLFQLSKYSLVTHHIQMEFIIILIAIVFLFVGIYLHKKSLSKSPSIPNEIDHKKIEQLEITKREYEVLQKIEIGLSNKEIANELFVSESTIKTHVSSLLLKLNARRRTQAIQIAKEHQII